MGVPKPLAVRVLEQRKIAHEVFAFDTDIRSAEKVARTTGMPPAQVLKTLVVELDPPRGKPYLVMLPSDGELDLKLLASGLGVKKLRMATHRDAERQTGLQVGGISALALLNKGFAVLIDASATANAAVLVSAGQRGMDVRLAVSDLVALTKARLFPCVQQTGPVERSEGGGRPLGHSSPRPVRSAPPIRRCPP